MFKYYRNHKFDVNNSRVGSFSRSAMACLRCVFPQTDDEGDDFAENFGLEHLSAAKQWNSAERSQSMKNPRRKRGRRRAAPTQGELVGVYKTDQILQLVVPGHPMHSTP